MEIMMKGDDEGRFDIWNSIQKVKGKETTSPAAEWPQDALLRQPSSLMTQNSLELCTEGLGSETGSDGFSSADELDHFFSPLSSKTNGFRDNRALEGASAAKLEMQGRRRDEMLRAHPHCCNGRPSPPPFPPPLSSGGIQMKSVRSDGRLLVTAVPVPSHNHLHAERHGGRLLLSFADTYFQLNTSNILQEQRNLLLEEEEEDVEEEEEVKLIDCGAKVEVKVNPHHQLINGTPTVRAFRVNGPAEGSLTTVTAAAAAAVATPADGFHCSRLHLHHPRRIDQIIWTVT